MSLRSPLSRAQGLGSAKSGSHHWYAQRVSSVAVTLLGLWFVAAILALGSLEFDTVVAWLAQPTTAVLCAVFVAASAHHAWLGLEVVIEDYVGHRVARILVLLITRFVLILAGVTGVLAVLRIALGSRA